MNRTLSLAAIVALSLLSAACTTLSPEQMAKQQSTPFARCPAGDCNMPAYRAAPAVRPRMSGFGS